jgi:acyl-CoA-binding protein
MLNRIVILLTLVAAAAATGFYDTVIANNAYALDNQVNAALDSGATLVGGLNVVKRGSYNYQYNQAILWSTREQAKAHYTAIVERQRAKQDEEQRRQANSTWRWW